MHEGKRKDSIFNSQIDENFSVRSLRKYQLKEILAAHRIPYLSNITRSDLINLFIKNIEPHRQEILREYKQKQLEKKASEVQETYGRGHRVQKKVEQPNELDRLHQLIHKKDADGFTIPQAPASSSSKDYFNPEDSFASEDDTEFSIQKTVKTQAKQPKTITTVNKSSRRPKKIPKMKGTHAKKSSPSSFNPDDSFASSGAEDPNEYEPLTTQFYSEDNESDLEKEEAKEKKNEEIIEEKKEEVVVEEDDDDEDYNADTDDSDEDEDLGQVDQEELVLLYKDQAVPPEVFVSSGYRDKSQTLANASARFHLWKARCTRILYGLCGLYLLVGSIGLVITSIARKNNGYCNSYPKEVNQTESTTGFFSLLPSSCIPCPDHGVCKGGELMCDSLYERRTPLYNFHHWLPVGDDCVHNSVLGKYIAKVERHIKHKLATEQGKATCEHLLAHPDQSPGEVPPTRVAVKDIMADLNRSIKSHLPAEKMEEILVIALSAVLEDPKVHYWET